MENNHEEEAERRAEEAAQRAAEAQHRAEEAEQRAAEAQHRAEGAEPETTPEADEGTPSAGWGGDNPSAGWGSGDGSNDLSAMTIRPRVWDRQRPINKGKQTEIVGGIAAPLLAGFSLTTVAQLVISSYRPWLTGYAIAAFALAAAFLLNSLQFSATALGYGATPSERLDYVPEVASDIEILGIIRKRQWEEMGLRDRYIGRARFCYNAGLLAFLGGLGLIIVPHRSWPWPAEQLIGVIVVGFSVVFEMLWIFSGATWPKSLFPRATKGDPPEPKASTDQPYMPDTNASNLLFGGARPQEPWSGDILGNLRRCVELLEQISKR